MNSGILAGMRPCGIIILLGELFTAESKTQVYGFLHNFFLRHPKVVEDLGNAQPFFAVLHDLPNLQMSFAMMMPVI